MNFSTPICVVGDLHFKASNLVEADQLARAIIRSVPPECEAVVFLGDILDNHATVHSQAYNVAYQLVKAVSATKRVFLLVGNHDYINNSQFLSDEHPFNAFKEWGERVTVVDRVVCWQSYLFVPYVPPGRLNDALGAIDFGPIEAVFCHQEFEGVLFKGQGDPWPSSRPLAVSGHIHDRWQVAPNVLYVGTPVQHSFAENTDKGISLFSGSEERRICLGLPTKETIETTVDELPGLKLNPNANTRIILRGNPSQLTSFKKTKLCKELLGEKVKIVPVPDEKNTQQLKQMVKKRRTYLEALEEAVNNGSSYMKAAFSSILKGFSQ